MVNIQSMVVQYPGDKMNPVIRKLMIDAIFHVDNIGDDPDGDVGKMYIPNAFAEKFAELVVNECVIACGSNEAAKWNINQLFGKNT